MRTTNKKGHGIMRAIYGAFLVIILIGVMVFFAFTIYGVAIPGITTGSSSSSSSNSSNQNAPAWVIITTTNKTLAKSIITTNIISPFMPPLILQPNTVYKYSVTVEVLNSAGKVLNIPVEVSFWREATVIPGLNVSITPASGVSPYNATLIIITGNTINMGNLHDASIAFIDNITYTQVFGILIANATSMK